MLGHEPPDNMSLASVSGRRQNESEDVEMEMEAESEMAEVTGKAEVQSAQEDITEEAMKAEVVATCSNEGETCSFQDTPDIFNQR